MFIKSKIQFFESKSQHAVKSCKVGDCCLSSQRYNFLKANHNECVLNSYCVPVVYQVKDTIFWKQITTYFYSESLLFCCLSSQRYNFLKANHNVFVLQALIPLVVYQVKDTIFWKQITTNNTHVATIKGCLSSQRYNFLKANHNDILLWINQTNVVYQVKDTIFWKQITTQNVLIYRLESCLSSQRYNFLKANHNIVIYYYSVCQVVYQVKDTIFWKQITTNYAKTNQTFPLFIKSKIQFFESKSQQ